MKVKRTNELKLTDIFSHSPAAASAARIGEVYVKSEPENEDSSQLLKPAPTPAAEPTRNASNRATPITVKAEELKRQNLLSNEDIEMENVEGKI